MRTMLIAVGLAVSLSGCDTVDDLLSFFDDAPEDAAPVGPEGERSAAYYWGDQPGGAPPPAVTASNQDPFATGQQQAFGAPAPAGQAPFGAPAGQAQSGAPFGAPAQGTFGQATAGRAGAPPQAAPDQAVFAFPRDGDPRAAATAQQVPVPPPAAQVPPPAAQVAPPVAPQAPQAVAQAPARQQAAQPLADPFAAGRDHAVYLGFFDDAGQSRAWADSLWASNPGVLGPVERRVLPDNSHGGPARYHIYGVQLTQQQAQSICDVLQPQNIRCMPWKY